MANKTALNFYLDPIRIHAEHGLQLWEQGNFDDALRALKIVEDHIRDLKNKIAVKTKFGSQ